MWDKYLTIEEWLEKERERLGLIDNSLESSNSDSNNNWYDKFKQTVAELEKTDLKRYEGEHTPGYDEVY